MSAQPLRAVPRAALPSDVNTPPDTLAVPPVSLPAPTTAAARVLRVLSGAHTGAESQLHAERLLVGNLEGECDVVLDVGCAERHACLVRASSDSWTVLVIAGDLWLGDQYVPAQQTREIKSGQVLTLGRVAFCVADRATTDWARIKPPVNLVKPDADGPLPRVAMLAKPQSSLRKWQALKLASGIGISGLVLASAGAYLVQAYSTSQPTAEAAEAQLKAHQSLVAALPYGKEVTLQRHPESAKRVLVQGYVPQRAQIPALQAALLKADTDAEMRLVALDDLNAELVRRLDPGQPERVRYEAQGRFTVTTPTAEVAAHDRHARMALLEVPVVNALDLQLTDMNEADGKPVIVRYARSTERPGDLLVTNLDTALGKRAFTVQELRLGSLPSVVLDNGLRYFTGAVLPDGSTLKSLDASNMRITRPGGAESVVSLASAPRVTAAEQTRTLRQSGAGNQRK